MVTSPVEITSGGIALVGTLDVPELEPGQRVPLVVIMHRLFGDQEEAVLVATSRALVARGIATLRFDFIGQGRSGGRFIDMTVPIELAEAADVVAFARALPFVSTLGLVGHSQGGVVASMLAGRMGSDVGAIVLLAPAVIIRDDTRAGTILGASFDPDDLPEQIEMWGYPLGREFLRTGQELPILDDSSPYEGPMLVLAAGADEHVPLSPIEAFASRMTDARIVVLDGKDHFFEPDVQRAATLAADFLREHLV
ncbi:alpha/beta hydrolase [Demequina sp. NBRC 110054]|uniref:alpha/beta hydrolase n=1 Tax=Demequina sp. NBRC 110054 TaxID=1570343 RepID=UPI0009FE83AB|nr:alpha/beta fold hydrolase [Demequina sp. NBRC 110054]